MSDVYAFWRAACKKRAGDKIPDIIPLRTTGDGSDENPQAGLWRVRMRKGGPRLPVQIYLADESGTVVHKFREGLVVQCFIDGRKARWEQVWTFAEPVTKDEMKAYETTGHWPDEPAPISKSNLPDDPLQALLAEIEDKRAQAEEYLSKNPEIKSQTTADLFRNLQNQLLTLIKRGDGLFEVEKRPILEATRACDEKYRFRAALSVVATRLRQRYEGFLKAEEDRLKKEAAEKFKAEQERIRKERETIETTQAALMRDDPVTALTSDPLELPLMPAAPEAVHVSAGGGSGRKAGLRTVYVGEITDFKAVMEHFSDHADLKAVIDKLVARAVKAGGAATKVPGVKVVEDRRAA